MSDGESKAAAMALQQASPNMSEGGKGTSVSGLTRTVLYDEEKQSPEYEMESAVFDYDQVKTSDQFGIKVYHNAVFKGILVNASRNGNGVMVYNNGRVYEGEWMSDKRHGQGYERYSNGNLYEGQFERGRAHGKGVYKWKSGEVYDGEWKQGVKEGYGVWKGVDGDSYIGEWRNSRAHGYGVHTWKNGDRYEGEWGDCLKHGQGTDIFANGDIYVGTYIKGKPEGEGQYKWANGSTYNGAFKNGMKHGKGTWKKGGSNVRSNCYEGEYFMDNKHGYGEFTWASGNRYKGNYLDDERHGYGEMYWTDGSVYKGQWAKGIQHGYGEMSFPDGSKKVGIFENNVFKGSVDSYSPDKPPLPRSTSQATGSRKKPRLKSSERDASFDIERQKSRIRQTVGSPRTQISKKTESPNTSFMQSGSKVSRQTNRGGLNQSTMLPEIERSGAKSRDLRIGRRKKNRTSKLTREGSVESRHNQSFEIGKVSTRALALIEKNKLKELQQKRAAWKPSGSVTKNDGYTPAPKLYF